MRMHVKCIDIEKPKHIEDFFVIISVASGKGGTGKTTVAVNLALSLQNVHLLGCDVEEPNAHIFLNPQITDVRPVHILVPKVDEALCNYCGECSKICQYHSIVVIPNKVMVFPELCHGCGGCTLVCPKKAITEEHRQIGVVKKGKVRDMNFTFGELNIGEPMSVPVIREVKKEIDLHKINIVDAPPGTSCPVVASVYGSDYTVLVTEPTPFGLHDLKLMVAVLREIKIPFGVIVNRAGIGDKRLYNYCQEEHIPILLEIPFDRRIAELYSTGVPFIKEMPEWRERFLRFFEDVTGRVGE